MACKFTLVVFLSFLGRSSVSIHERKNYCYPVSQRPSQRNLLNIREFILVRNPISVRSVERPLIVAPSLPDIKGFTLVKNPMSVRNVERPLVVAQNLLSMREFTLVRSPMSVRNVGSLLFVAHSLHNIREFILVRSPMNVKNVEWPLYDFRLL